MTGVATHGIAHRHGKGVSLRVQQLVGRDTEIDGGHPEVAQV
jgi:hypothetical protein